MSRVARASQPRRLVALDGAVTAALPGKVWLVGAGPGDPELLTLKAARLIAAAGVIVHDGLVSTDILAMAAPGARLIDVAKRKSRHTLPQDDINRLLVAFARRNRALQRLRSDGVNVDMILGYDAVVGVQGDLSSGIRAA
eukprot:gene33451-biopygen21642